MASKGRLRVGVAATVESNWVGIGDKGKRPLERVDGILLVGEGMKVSEFRLAALCSRVGAVSCSGCRKDSLEVLLGSIN